MEKKSWKTLFLCSGLSKFPLGLAQSACSFGALSEISQSEQVSGCCVLFDIVRFLGHCLNGTHMSTPCSSISEAHRLRLEYRLNFCSHSWETKTRVEQLLPALCFYPLLSRILTHTRITPFSRFSPYKVTMSDSIHGLLLLCPCLSSSSLRLHVSLSLLFLF